MILVISGASGSGKTSACAVVESLARAAGIPIGGVLCRAVFEGGRKTGIAARDLSGGPGTPAEPLARALPGSGAAPPDGASPPGRGTPPFDDSDARVLRYGMWEFDKAALGRADEAATRGIASAGSDAANGEESAIAVIDEIGPLELDLGAGMTGTLAALDREASAEGARSMRCIVVARPDIAGRLVARWRGSTRIDMGGSSPEEVARAALAALDPGLTGSRRS